MNDWEAMEAVSDTLEQFFRGNLQQGDALMQIANIVGQNSIAHQEAKP